MSQQRSFLQSPSEIKSSALFSPVFSFKLCIYLYYCTQPYIVSNLMIWTGNVVMLQASCCFVFFPNGFYSAHLFAFHSAGFGSSKNIQTLLQTCSIHQRWLLLNVTVTCTQLPLPSHWSRSPGSCPCSRPAPGHIQKSPYKCSHTSHL